MVLQKFARHATSAKSIGMWINLFCNIIIPSIIMLYLPEYIGAILALVIALLFPLWYGVFEWYEHRRLNFFSLVGFIGTLLTGGVWVLKLWPTWMIYKETGVPILIAIYMIVSMKTSYSFVQLLLNSIFDMDKLKRILKKKRKFRVFYRQMVRSSYLLWGAYLVNAALNFILSRTVVSAPAGTIEFTQQVGELTALSFPVVTFPTVVMVIGVLYYLFSSIKDDIDQSLDRLMR